MFGLRQRQKAPGKKVGAMMPETGLLLLVEGEIADTVPYFGIDNAS
jgi:hypothetical protein